MGFLWPGASVVTLLLKPILAAVRERHLAARLPSLCDEDRVHEAKAGFRNAGLAYRPVTKLAHVPLPAAVTWQLVALAIRSLPARRHQLTAVVLQFWWMRRAGDVTRLTFSDVDVRAEGSTAYQVPRHKTKAEMGLIARRMPAAVHTGADLPHVLLAQLVGDFHAAGRPPTARLFTSCRPDAAAALVTTWLLDGSRRLGVTPAVGTVYASHSLKSVSRRPTRRASTAVPSRR